MLEESLAPRLVAPLELQMSCMAMASVVERHSTPARSDPVQQLVAAARRPGAHFMLQLLEISGARTQADLLNVAAEHLAEDEVLPSEATLKRWFSGAVLPPARRIRPLALAIARATNRDSTEADLHLLFWCARRASTAMSLAGLVHKIGGAPALLASKDVPSWAEAACAHWAARWRGRPSPRR